MIDPSKYSAAGFEVHHPSLDDHGLGFGKGSVMGVYNTYYRKGFLRDQLPETDVGLRNMFNLRGHRGAEQYYQPQNPYQCHYDPKPYFDSEYPPFRYDHSIMSKWLTKPLTNIYDDGDGSAPTLVEKGRLDNVWGWESEEENTINLEKFLIVFILLLLIAYYFSR